MGVEGGCEAGCEEGSEEGSAEGGEEGGLGSDQTFPRIGIDSKILSTSEIERVSFPISTRTNTIPETLLASLTTSRTYCYSNSPFGGVSTLSCWVLLGRRVWDEEMVRIGEGR